ncbi:type II toxin-antitoxin system RelE/ParE family toxin [Ochrobactrum sp. Q0168]|uniref:type II toxin-antitoxin system RelE/ParE family toxin n=1 Tax=Ochrobactrum sp. Q0168 TaxID=2793241 RepID=UPI0018ED02F8|nr:type II toxin-antitoxin system RelE/ParE family toxin [Ochrobactrum sp. Q0168]
MIVEFSDEAESDLEQIADDIAEDNPGRALSFVQELRGKCEALAANPLAFSLVPRYESYGIRRRVHGNYLIFYHVRVEQVVIVHVLHGASDYAALLFEG